MRLRFVLIHCVYLLIYATFKLEAEEQFCLKSQEDCAKSTENYSDFFGRYTFPTKPIETLQCQSEKAAKFMENAVPVVLKNCHFGNITKDWTIEYLKNNLVSPNLTVYLSSSRRFLFYNNIRRNYTWTPPHQMHEMNFSQFLDVVNELDKAENQSKAYLQTDLVKEQLNSDMQDDIFLFNTIWLQNLKKRLEWGPLDVNLFLVGMPGVVTPAHYDIMENLFVQIHGKKRCILFSPESYKFLYPFPLHHPHDRQTQVNFDAPDFNKFPKFRNISGVDAVLEPGDVLYIPNYWWHYIESERNSKTISMNFWYQPKGEEPFEQREEIDIKEKENKDAMERTTKESDKENSGFLEENSEKEFSNGQIMDARNETEIVTLTAGELIGLSREIEELVANAIGDTTKVGQFLKTMTDGRYDFV